MTADGDPGTSSDDLPPPPSIGSGSGGGGGDPPSRGTRTLGWLRRFAKVWGFALFCVFVVYVFREVVLPFIFAILVAYVLAPVVDRMAKIRMGSRTMPRGLAVIILYINIIAVLGVFMGYFVPKLYNDFARLFREAPELLVRAKNEWVPRAGLLAEKYFGAGGTGEAGHPAGPAAAPGSGEPARREIVVEPLADGRFRIDLDAMSLEVKPLEDGKFLIGPPHPEVAALPSEGRWERAIRHRIDQLVSSTEGLSRRALEFGQKFLTAVATGFARTILVLMVAAFILIDLMRIRGFLRSLVPEAYQLDYDRIAKSVDKGLSGVIRGQLIICLVNGVLTYVGLVLFDVKYPLLLGGVAAVMSLVPIFGSILSSVPIVAIALISSGNLDLRNGLFVLGWIVLIHLFEANFLNPKIMGDAAKIHPVLVVFALIAGEHSYGFVGALFAVPVASIIQTIFLYYRRRQFSRLAGP